MRVLHASPYFAPAFGYGGPPRSIFGLCRALRQASIDARVVTTTADGDGELGAAPDGTDYDGVPVRYCARAFPRFVWNASDLRAAIRAELAGADLVHLHGLWHAPGWIAAAEARRAGIPYVISPRGMLQPAALAHHAWRKRVAFAAVERRHLARAALLHATSPDEADTLAVGRFGARVALVPNGVDVPSPASGPKGLNGRRVVLYVGRIHPIKRLDLLAAAARRMITPDVTVVIAGPDEQGHRTALEPLFDGLDVLWTGPVDDDGRSAWYGRAEVAVVCSDSESFGLTIAEALAASVPVVATRTCPWPELETEQAGRWVAQDAGAIAAALDDILGDAALARSMGARGRDLVRRRYSWERVGAAMAAEYARVIGQVAA